MKTRVWTTACAVGLAVVVALPASGQDTTSMLSAFLRDLRNQTLGVVNAITSITVSGAITAGAGSSAAPSYTFTGSTTSGLYFPGGGAGPVIDSQGVPAMYFSSAPSADMRSDALVRWMSTTSLPGTADTVLSRGGVNLFRMGNATTGLEYNFDTPTVSTCGTGTVTTGSKASAGEIVATGATACTVNFTTAFTNTPFCVVEDETTNLATEQRISAISTTAFTVTGLTSGDTFMYHCTGRY